MQLFSNEKILSSSNGDKIILTSQRIHSSEKEWGRSYKITVALEDISSIEYKYASNILWLILAILSGAIVLLMVGAMINEGPQGEGGGIVIPIIAFIAFTVLYFLSRQAAVVITPNGGKALQFSVSGMSEEAVDDFLYRLQVAKAQRIYALYNEPFVQEEGKKKFFETTEN